MYTRLHAYDQHLNMVLSEVEARFAVVRRLDTALKAINTSKEISYVREEVPGKESQSI